MIAIKKISKYFGTYAALRHFSLDLKAGQKCCLVGKTGSGKTTLLRLIAGLEQPDAGEIIIDGRLASSRSAMVPPHQRQIGMVFQNLAIWPHLTAVRHLVMVMNSHQSRREKEEKALGILSSLDMSEYARSYPGMLSGGQRQKLAIARLLASQPRIALCDEPYAHLDPASKEAVRSLVNNWITESHITFIMVTHDPLEDFSFFDTMVALRQGSLVAWDKPGDLQDLFRMMDPGAEGP
ncbi:MAG: ATP-binding cassette domain-containing protein [Proteobacteria bacterium]|nr:ATP-binding cassette domain-containing protein [Pseudomonadota bacterium]MBU4354730.1 ATP-binding cassette domain-containing protein [Pseudomonadota bacterium]MBU4448965.1 ATP-binding cassette domain-containing protein [Pseudomonadota bacterium]MCG2773156.1 ATP-binding cassette domain-containing protein [Desulfobacterales bacterium]